MKTSNRKSSRTTPASYRVVSNGRSIPVIRLWGTGLSVDESDAARLGAEVGLFEGNRRVAECLLVRTVGREGEATYEFKRRTAVRDAPALDFAQTTADWLPV